MRLPPAGVLLIGMLATVGCGSGSTGRVAAPSYDPDAMAAAALSALDANGNGTIEGAELDACPALKSALPGIDTNRDRKVSADELKARFTAYKAQAAGAVGVAASVTLDVAPLPDATVTFTPEPFMGAAAREATAVTRADGSIATFSVGGESLPGLPCGLYRVKVSKPGPEGQETIPARYNTQTTLGCEVFAGRSAGRLEFKLFSR